MKTVAIVLILLHGPGGNHIWINPDEVTSLRAGQPGEEGKHFTNEAHCMISLSDGKFVTVVEPCDEVQRRIMEKQDGR